MAAAVHPHVFSGDIKLIEAEAMIFGLRIAKDLGLFLLIVEADANNVVELASGKIITEKEIDSTIAELQSIANELRGVQFVHAHRNCNVKAHNLVKYVVIIQKFLVWIEEYP